MTGKDQINRALRRVWDSAEVGASQIRYEFIHGTEPPTSGWWVHPFGEESIFLGLTIPEALKTIDRFRTMRPEGYN